MSQPNGSQLACFLCHCNFLHTFCNTYRKPLDFLYRPPLIFILCPAMGILFSRLLEISSNVFPSHMHVYFDEIESSWLYVCGNILSVKFVINFSQLKHVSDVNLMPASRGVLNDIKFLRDKIYSVTFLWTCHLFKQV